MRTFFSALCIFTLLVASAGSVMAEDLVGKWTETDNWGARAGASEHDLGHGDYFLHMGNAKFSLVITEQSEDKRSFHGEWCGKKGCEDVVGAIMTDGTILMADEDGFFQGVRTGDSLELCYMEAEPHFRVVNCRTMKRE